MTQTEAIAKMVLDIDAFVQAVLKSIPPNKPWQRQLLLHLSEADRHMQVLRMVIAMDREKQEIQDASDRLSKALHAADAYAAAVRGDAQTKAAIHIAHQLSRQLLPALANS
ncbi:hypothetical protein ACS5PN_26635 [Roseateles sp. NT4]|uniref:hypothetical protein n=1 Tax=Roseateles sp. NT4 TaxID=3453715 RepID=UPI003EEF8368